MMRLPILALALAAQAAPALAQDVQTGSQGGTGALVSAEGVQLGNVSVSATISGHSVALINAQGFAEGVYGIHLHQVGVCDAPSFESAGPHIGEENQHGILVEAGPHPGDLPNAYVGPDTQLVTEGFAIGLTGEMVFDEDGSALIVHSRFDDYMSQPGGESGDRIACAVIEPAPGTLTDETVDADVVEPPDQALVIDEAQQEAVIGQESDDRTESDATLQGEVLEEDAGEVIEDVLGD